MTIIDLPSGMRAEIRPLKGKDFSALSDRTLSPEQQIERVLNATLVRVIDDGPYRRSMNGELINDARFVGDDHEQLYQVRMATFPGEAYPVQWKCTSCGETIYWDVDLSALERRMITPDVAEQLRTENKFRCSFNFFEEGLRQVTFKLTTRRDQRDRALRARQKKKERARRPEAGEATNDMVGPIASRLLAVEGYNLPNVDAIERFVGEMSWSELFDLRDEFEKIDFGVKTRVPVRCGDCGEEQDHDVPFQPSFFSPTRSRSRAKKPTADDAAT